MLYLSVKDFLISCMYFDGSTSWLFNCLIQDTVCICTSKSGASMSDCNQHGGPVCGKSNHGTRSQIFAKATGPPTV